jgi:protoheme IX farnesyltransferase
VRRTITSKLRDYYTLTKPEVNLLILMTTSAGYYLGSRGPLRAGRFFITLVGTLLVASATATLNQWMERRYDAHMRRTANRPLVSGRLGTREACWFGLLLSVAGGVLLAASVNAVSALLAIGTLLGYLLVYTPLKRKTPLCTLLGAVPGAMPTLIGWAAASGSVGRNAWLVLEFSFCGSSLIS